MGGSIWNEIETSLARDWNSVGDSVGANMCAVQAIRSAIMKNEGDLSNFFISNGTIFVDQFMPFSQMVPCLAPKFDWIWN